MLAGYGHPLYAESLSEFGEPVALPGSRGWLLERSIGAGSDRDGMGPYPLFCCANWSGLRNDLEALRARLVSVVLVADPFGGHDGALLRSCFDRVLPFKTHFVVDFEQPGVEGSTHHRYRARRARREVQIDLCEKSQSKLAEWIALYEQLIARHAITGVQAFSSESFRRQFDVPGLVLMRAMGRGQSCLGAQLWFVQGEVAYSHLTAISEQGYRCACSYALHEAALRYFRGRVRWLDLGGSAGLESRSDGLASFKRGWSNTSRTAFLCGRVLNPRRYTALCEAAATGNSEYFPGYRWREAA